MPRLPSGSRRKRPYTIIGAEELAVLRKHLDPSAVLPLEMMRLSGLRWVKRRDGWVSVKSGDIAGDRADRSEAAPQSRSAPKWMGMAEIRGTDTHGRKLDSLNPNWAKPSAEIVDLQAVKAKHRLLDPNTQPTRAELRAVI